jgi:hypothetical protein
MLVIMNRFLKEIGKDVQNYHTSLSVYPKTGQRIHKLLQQHSHHVDPRLHQISNEAYLLTPSIAPGFFSNI